VSSESDGIFGKLGKLIDDIHGVTGTTPKSEPKPKPKVQLRKKFIGGRAYIDAADVADLLERSNIQPGLVKTLRNLKENP
jgi:hypothetical protein